jgi:hypothetical protein
MICDNKNLTTKKTKFNRYISQRTFLLTDASSSINRLLSIFLSPCVSPFSPSIFTVSFPISMAQNHGFRILGRESFGGQTKTRNDSTRRGAHTHTHRGFKKVYPLHISLPSSTSPLSTYPSLYPPHPSPPHPSLAPFPSISP